jgi:hypothetical protein
MAKVYVDMVNVSHNVVYMSMYMVNVPHDMLKSCVDIVNVPHGMTKASMDMLHVSGYDKSIHGHSKCPPGHGNGIHIHDI